MQSRLGKIGKAGAGKKKSVVKKKMGAVADVKAVMFVPYTAGSKLAKDLREAEEKLGSLTGYRLKMVEKAGDKLEDLLSPTPGRAWTVAGPCACCVRPRGRPTRTCPRTAIPEI